MAPVFRAVGASLAVAAAVGAAVAGEVTNLHGFAIEYQLAPRIVVFSHGFGVARDSRGLFTDLAASLPQGWGYVLFEYNDKTDKQLRLTDFKEQQARLKKVLQWAKSQPDVSSVAIVAHSMGCIVTALLRPSDVERVILLAPPVSIGERTRQYFTTKPGAEHHGKVWYVPRRDGTTSVIPESLFTQFESIDAQAALTSFSRRKAYTLIIAGHDEILGSVDYSKIQNLPNVNWIAVEEADHNFNGPSRARLIDSVRQVLAGAA